MGFPDLEKQTPNWLCGDLQLLRRLRQENCLKVQGQTRQQSETHLFKKKIKIKVSELTLYFRLIYMNNLLVWACPWSINLFFWGWNLNVTGHAVFYLETLFLHILRVLREKNKPWLNWGRELHFKDAPGSELCQESHRENERGLRPGG